MDLGNHALVGGVDDVEGLAFLALDELVVDEAGWAVSEDVQELRPPKEDFGGVVTSGASLTGRLAARTCRSAASQAGRKSYWSDVFLFEGVANREQWHNRVCLTMGEEREI